MSPNEKYLFHARPIKGEIVMRDHFLWNAIPYSYTYEAKKGDQDYDARNNMYASLRRYERKKIKTKNRNYVINLGECR